MKKAIELINNRPKLKLLFVYPFFFSFVKKDFEILKTAYDVKKFCYCGIGSILMLWNRIKWCDVIFIWFGKLHAFFAVLLSKILGKKTIVVAGGDDVAHVPEIKYGMFSYWWKKWCPLFVFKHADLIIPVSEFNKAETIKNAKANPQMVKMVYHGFSGDKIRRIHKIPKENIVITIGRVSQETKVKKGLELFVRSASFLSGIKFFLIGPDIDGTLEELRNISPSNLEITGGIYGKKLVEICNRAKVYVQVSIHESFGCSLAEAMLCECIPVVSRNGAIPEVVGDTGIYVKELTPENVAEKIKCALNLPDDYGTKARKRVIDNFSYDDRKTKILKVVEELT